MLTIFRAGLLHGRIDGLGHQEGGCQVDVVDGLPLFQGHLLGRLADGRPGVVEQDVDPAEAVEDRPGGPFDLRRSGEVGGQGERLDPGLGVQLAQRRPRFFGVAGGDRDPRPARANPRAIPRPIPPLPPVTSATLPVRSKRFGAILCKGSGWDTVGPLRLRPVTI